MYHSYSRLKIGKKTDAFVSFEMSSKQNYKRTSIMFKMVKGEAAIPSFLSNNVCSPQALCKYQVGTPLDIKLASLSP